MADEEEAEAEIDLGATRAGGPIALIEEDEEAPRAREEDEVDRAWEPIGGRGGRLVVRPLLAAAIVAEREKAGGTGLIGADNDDDSREAEECA